MRNCRVRRYRTSQARRRTPRPGSSVRRQRQSSPSSRPSNGSGGEEQVAVEVDPLGQRRDGRRGGDPDRRLLHAAQERPEAELAGPGEHPGRRSDPAALGQLDVDPVDDPDQPVEVVDRDRALVGHDRQRRRRLEGRQVVEATGRERLLDELDAERTRSGRSRVPSSSDQPVLASTRIGPVVDRPDRGQRLEVGRPAELDLERREADRPGGPLGDDRRLVDPDREVGRRDLGRQAEQLVDGDPEDLADQVVEGDVERALGRPVVGIASSMPGRSPARPASSRSVAADKSSSNGSTAADEARQDGGHRRPVSP